MSNSDTWLTPGGDTQPLVQFCDLQKPPALEDMIAAAAVGVEVVEAACGPIVDTTITETVDVARPVVAVRYPARDATHSTGVPLACAGQTIRTVDGSDVPAGTITYTAGYAATTADAPSWAVTAGRLVARHFWRSLQTNQRATPESAGYLVPNQAQTLMAPHELAPGGFA